jgi:hypothetical protein
MVRIMLNENRLPHGRSNFKFSLALLHKSLRGFLVGKREVNIERPTSKVEVKNGKRLATSKINNRESSIESDAVGLKSDDF